MAMTRGRRRGALKLSLCFHVVAWVALLAGTLTPYWSRVTSVSTGKVISYVGLLTTCDDVMECKTIDLNLYKDHETDKYVRYGVVAVSFGIIAMVTEFFLMQTYCFAACNQSCGKKYSPDVLIFMSIITVFMIVVCMVMFQMQQGNSDNDVIDIKWDYSRYFVIGAAALIFLAGFVTVWDRKGENKKKALSPLA